jgi:hypothetical protein
MAYGFWMVSIGLAIAKTGNAFHVKVANANIVPVEDARTVMAKGLSGDGFSFRTLACFARDRDYVFFAVATACAVCAMVSVGAEAASAVTCQVGLVCIRAVLPNLGKGHSDPLHLRAGNG